MESFIRIFDCDMVFAGLARIEKRGGKDIVIKTDDRGRTIDVHALRHTFGTHLSKAGVPLRTAQAAMRHSDPSLTANVYTDPKLLDVAGAVACLPDLPLGKVERSAAPASHDEGFLSMIALGDRVYPLACVRPFGGGFGA
ncbi:MAG: tyrosine-type recombinase/integrase [Phycisphaerales bacterium]